MLLLDFNQFSFLGGDEFLTFGDDLGTAGTGFERNGRLFGMLRLFPAVIFMHRGVILVIVIGVVALLLILDMVRFTI
jgi:hypothetical protein